jgi:hypothetical protein
MEHSRTFFPENSAILTSLSYEDLYRRLKNVMEQPQLLQDMHDTSQAYLETLSWAKTGKQFSEILETLL